MLVSTFELLVKNQFPRDLPPNISDRLKAKIDKLSRTVIQGYFLTIANVTSNKLYLSLVFTALTPAINANDTLVFLDVRGPNLLSNVDLVAPNKPEFRL